MDSYCSAFCWILFYYMMPLPRVCPFSKDTFNDSVPQTQLGTALFSAPEIFLTAKGQTYDAACADIWSCGVVLFTMLFGSHPFLKSATSTQKADQIMQVRMCHIRSLTCIPHTPTANMSSTLRQATHSYPFIMHHKSDLYLLP
jgi:serine/threonine protein kinase